VIEWLPTARPEVVKVVCPVLKVELPSAVVPSRKVTVPVAEEGETVAVNVTDWPEVDGLRVEVAAVVVLALFAVTVCETAPEIPPVSLLSPL